MVDTEMILQAINGINGRLDKMDGRLDKMESRLDKMESRLDNMDSRFDKMESRFDNMESEMNQRFDTLEKKVTRLEIIIENDIKPDIKKLSEHQLGLREQLEEYKAQVDDRLGTSDLVNLLADYSKKHC